MRRHVRVGVVLLVVGVALVAGPLVLYDVHGPEYAVDLREERFDRSAPSGEVVAHADLPADVRAAIDPGFRSGPSDLGLPMGGSSPDHVAEFTRPEWRAADGLRSADYVEYEGRYYAVEVYPHVAEAETYLPEPFLSLVTVVPPTLGAGLAALGGALLAWGWPRTLTPSRATAVSGAAALGTAASYGLLTNSLTYADATAIYVDPTPVPGGYLAVVRIVATLALATTPLAVLGAALATRDLGWIGGSLLVAAVVGTAPAALGRVPASVVAVGLGVVVALVGSPLCLGGYLLTDPPDVDRVVGRVAGSVANGRGSARSQGD